MEKGFPGPADANARVFSWPFPKGEKRMRQAGNCRGGFGGSVLFQFLGKAGLSDVHSPRPPAAPSSISSIIFWGLERVKRCRDRNYRVVLVDWGTGHWGRFNRAGLSGADFLAVYQSSYSVGSLVAAFSNLVLQR